MQQGEVYGEFGEERERRNNVTVISKINQTTIKPGTVICTSSPRDEQVGTKGWLGLIAQVANLRFRETPFQK